MMGFEPTIGQFMGYHEGCGGEVYEEVYTGRVSLRCEDCDKRVRESAIVPTEAECHRCPDCDGLTETAGHLCNQCKAEGREEGRNHGGNCHCAA